jgi:hypothetical protein
MHLRRHSNPPNYDASEQATHKAEPDCSPQRRQRSVHVLPNRLQTPLLPQACIIHTSCERYASLSFMHASHIPPVVQLRELEIQGLQPRDYTEPGKSCRHDKYARVQYCKHRKETLLARLLVACWLLWCGSGRSRVGDYLRLSTNADFLLLCLLIFTTRLPFFVRCSMSNQNTTHFWAESQGWRAIPTNVAQTNELDCAKVVREIERRQQ